MNDKSSPKNPDTPTPGRRVPVQFSALLAILLLAAGCAVGPDYRAPKTTMPEGWHALTQSGAGLARPSPEPPPELAAWWQGFQDPILASLMDMALKYNLDVKQAEARIDRKSVV